MGTSDEHLRDALRLIRTSGHAKDGSRLTEIIDVALATETTAVATEVSKSCDPPTTEPATEED